MSDEQKFDLGLIVERMTQENKVFEWFNEVCAIEPTVEELANYASRMLNTQPSILIRSPAYKN